MKYLITSTLLLLSVLFGQAANPDFRGFYGTNGILIRTNPATGLVQVDGSLISSPTGGVSAATVTNIINNLAVIDVGEGIVKSNNTVYIGALRTTPGIVFYDEFAGPTMGAVGLMQRRSSSGHFYADLTDAGTGGTNSLQMTNGLLTLTNIVGAQRFYLSVSNSAPKPWNWYGGQINFVYPALAIVNRTIPTIIVQSEATIGGAEYLHAYTEWNGDFVVQRSIAENLLALNYGEFPTNVAYNVFTFTNGCVVQVNNHYFRYIGTNFSFGNQRVGTWELNGGVSNNTVAAQWDRIWAGYMDPSMSASLQVYLAQTNLVSISTGFYTNDLNMVNSGILDDYVGIPNGPAAGRTNVLPCACSNPGRVLVIADSGGTAAGTNVTLATLYGQTIDGQSTTNITQNLGKMVLKSVAGNWKIVSVSMIASSGGATSPGGNSGDVQFNQTGTFAGTNDLNFDRTNRNLGVNGSVTITNTITQTGGGTGAKFSGALQFTTTGGNIIDASGDPRILLSDSGDTTLYGSGASGSIGMLVDKDGGLIKVTNGQFSAAGARRIGTNIPVGLNLGIHTYSTLETNASFQFVFTGTPLNGEGAYLSVSNISTSIIYVTNTAGIYDPSVASNVTTFAIVGTARRIFHFMNDTNSNLGVARWCLMNGTQKQMELAAGSNVTLSTNADSSIVTIAATASGGGTNFPAVLVLSDNTNSTITVGSGKRQSLTRTSGTNFTFNFSGTPLNGEHISLGVSNPSSAVIYITNTAGIYDATVASNVTTFSINKGSMKFFEFVCQTNLSLGVQRWEMRDFLGKEYELLPGTSIAFSTNAAESAITISSTGGFPLVADGNAAAFKITNAASIQIGTNVAEAAMTQNPTLLLSGTNSSGQIVLLRMRNTNSLVQLEMSVNGAAYASLGTWSSAGALTAVNMVSLGNMQIAGSQNYSWSGQASLYGLGNGNVGFYPSSGNWRGLTFGTQTASTPSLAVTNGDFIILDGTLSFGALATNRLIAPRFVVGNSASSTMTNMLTGSGTLDFASQTVGSVEDLPITVTGAADGDFVTVAPPVASITGIVGTFTGYASNNTVYVRFVSTGTAQNPGSGTFKVLVQKFL